MAKLERLRMMSISYNEITGTLPSEIATMRHINFIDLEGNSLQGTIPHEWFHSNVADFITIALGYNQISGTIPTDIQKWTSMNRLLLEHNRLTGTIPTELFALSFLGKLSMPRQKGGNKTAFLFLLFNLVFS